MYREALAMFVILCIGCSDSLPRQELSPPPPEIIATRVFDPESGLTDQPPLDSDWTSVVRWQGPVNLSFTQIDFNRYNSYIDTTHLPFRAVIGGGPHNVVSYNRASVPQSISNGLRMTWKQSVEEFSSVDGVAQLSAFFYIKHKDGAIWAVVINTWDNRPVSQLYPNNRPYVDNDTYTYFVSMPVSSSEFISSNQQHQHQPVPWQEYVVVMTPENLHNMLELMERKGVGVPSKNLDEYGLYDAGIIHEIFTFNNPNIHVRSHATFSTIRIETAQ